MNKMEEKKIKEKNLQEQELEILNFWKENKIYEKAKKKNKKNKYFYLMDGPPYATGNIHMGTALNKILKDIAYRSQRLQGKNVFDRAGYDTHGIPIEFQIEKEIGTKTKKDIENYGIKKFIEKCKEFATRFINTMNSEFENLGVWMDFKNPYLTLTNDYIEAIWDVFKEADKKGLLYLGKYPIHICPRCETAVAYNEIEYSKQQDTAIYVKFPLKEKEKTFLIIWTTTPWTLPGNTAVMINPNFIYSEIELENKERWIIAKDLVKKIMSELKLQYKEIKEYKGKELEGWKYENPLSKYINVKTKNAYKVVLSERYVNLEEGTGLVHSAPGHGKEDYEVGREYNLDILSPISLDGSLTEEAGKYKGKKARIVDYEIIEDLEKEDMLVYKHSYSHDYPMCWRCKSPLLMVSLSQWFLKISEIQKELLKENEEVKWIPSYMKLRMKAWLEGIGDWPVSRMRYWGTPLPIWICSNCNRRLVIGSIKELEKLSGKKIKEIHKPEIDEITIKCKCNGQMRRVSEVLDVWFDSGVSSWAALNYLKDKKQFKKYWPADLNIEGKDQIRGWWNSQLILSFIKFGKKPFKSISVHGMVLDLGKRKMSKSLGNIITPQEIIDKYGRDYLRYYFAKISKGEDISFDEKEFINIKNVFRVFININNYIDQLEKNKSKIEIEDKWILSKYNSLIKNVIESYNNYKFFEIIRYLEEFLIEDFSKTYIQLTRTRSNEIYYTTNEIRIGLLKLFAPIIPFLTEKIWQELKNKKIVKEESIHLTNFPKINNKLINKKIEKEFLLAKKIIEIVLRERDKEKTGLKWPLSKAIIKIKKEDSLSKDIINILLRYLNIKKIEILRGEELSVDLDTKITPELESEGYAREITRRIQEERKKAGLIKKDFIELKIQLSKNLFYKLKNFEKFIKEKVNAKKILITKENLLEGIEFNIKEEKIKIYFKKI
ncbi:MAG: isoleucine--tRNA ligase [Candidatus Pacearchaeota archaeon]